MLIRDPSRVNGIIKHDIVGPPRENQSPVLNMCFTAVFGSLLYMFQVHTLVVSGLYTKLFPFAYTFPDILMAGVLPLFS